MGDNNTLDIHDWYNDSLDILCDHIPSMAVNAQGNVTAFHVSRRHDAAFRRDLRASFGIVLYRFGPVCLLTQTTMTARTAPGLLSGTST